MPASSDAMRRPAPMDRQQAGSYKWRVRHGRFAYALHASIGARWLTNVVSRSALMSRRQVGSERAGAAWRGHGIHVIASSSARVAQTLSTSSTLVMPAMA
jgi:hypothetical protein